MGFCNSCGKPIGKKDYGTNEDCSPNMDYCIECFENGEFTEPDITLNEMMEKWHMLELIPGLECHFYTYDKSLTSEEISNIIDSDTEAVIGVYLRKDLILLI